MNVQQEIEKGRAFIATLPAIRDSALIGSATYLPEPADVDFAVLIEPGIKTFDYLAGMVAGGWKACSDYDSQDGKWGAVRSGNLNLMVTEDSAFFERYKAAMEVCRALHLTDKQDRIAVCQIVRDGRTADQVVTSRNAGFQQPAKDIPWA